MTPMPPYRRTQTLRQMSLALVAFAIVAVVLESGGLLEWAKRLEIGPERTIALPVCNELHRVLTPLGIEKQRHRILVGLAELGWSDDAALRASAVPASPSAATTVIVPASMTSLEATSSAVHETSTARPIIYPPPLEVSLADPPLSSSLPIPAASAPSAHAVVAITGDSMMAVGLSAAIQRDAPRFKNLTFLNLFKSGTGLARPEVFNWQFESPAMLRDSHPDFVVVAIGANDAQGFEQDKIVYPLGSAEWCRIYAGRVDAYLRMLTAHGATVVWIGLPPMKDPSFAARIDVVRRVQYSVVSASPHAIWFSSATLVGDTQGAFRDFGELRSHPVRLRAVDGIHLSDDGAELITAKLLPWLAAQSTKAPAAQPAKIKAPAKPKGDAGASESTSP